MWQVSKVRGELRESNRDEISKLRSRMRRLLAMQVSILSSAFIVMAYVVVAYIAIDPFFL